MSSRKSLAIAFAIVLLAGQTAHAAISFFQAEDSFAISPQPEFLSVADMNGDGLEDVVVISPRSDEVNVLLSFPDQPSRFSPVGVDRFGSSLRRGAAGDVTRDGNPDIVVPDQRQDGVWVLVGDGNGRVGNPGFFPVGRNPYAVAIADFDGVRGNDIAVTDQRLSNVTILLNDGGSPPRFTRGPIFTTGDEPLTVLAIDVNGDGEEDLVTLNEGGPRVKSISVLIFQMVTAGLPVFSAAENFSVGERPSSMQAADLNDDGFNDIVMLNRPTGTGNSDVNILISRGTGVFDGPTQFEVPCPFFTGGAFCRSRALTVGDFDNNGTVDLGVFLTDPRRAGTGSGIDNDALQIFAGRGDGQFNGGGVLRTPKTPISAIAVNLNGDDLIDLAGGFQRNTNITAFTNASTPGASSNGDPCTVGGSCLSGICVEGVCCASSCEDNESCALPRREGTCQRREIEVVPCTFDDECFDIPEPGDDGILSKMGSAARTAAPKGAVTSIPTKACASRPFRTAPSASTSAIATPVSAQTGAVAAKPATMDSAATMVSVEISAISANPAPKTASARPTFAIASPVCVAAKSATTSRSATIRAPASPPIRLRGCARSAIPATTTSSVPTKTASTVSAARWRLVRSGKCVSLRTANARPNQLRRRLRSRRTTARPAEFRPSALP